MTTSRPDAEMLLAHTDWVRALAAGLVADPSLADDVTQQTLVEAIERPPEDSRSLRNWLAVATRNVARAFARSDRRRARRERVAARPEATADTSELAERAALHRHLVDELLATAEPYQGVLLLRFFEDLPPREIARRLGRPVNTVRTQLQRGLGLMRHRLDREYGDRRAWCAALLPLIDRSAGVAVGVAWSLTGAFAMSKLIFAVAGAAAVTWLVWPGDEASPTNTVRNDVPAEPVGSVAEVPSTDRSAVPAAPEPVEPRPAYRARVVDLDGRPLAGVAFELIESRRSGESAAVATDSDGNLELPGAERMQHVRVADEGRIVFGEAEPADASTPIVLVGPAVALAGQVTDVDGAPIPDAMVDLGFEVTSLPGFPQTLRMRAGHLSWGDRTDAEGRFDAGLVPKHADLHVSVFKRGFRSMRTPTGELTGQPVHWTLRRAAHKLRVTGTVVDGAGVPTAARVAFGGVTAETAEDGRFEVIPGLRPGARLIAIADGYQPGYVDGLVERIREDPSAGLDLELRLGPPLLEIRGRVVDAGGEPLGGMLVEILDGQRFGESGDSVEQLLGFRWQRTRSDGTFVVGGLSERSYRVRARNTRTFLVIESDPIAAGATDAVLMAPRDPFLPELRGTVVDSRSLPIEGAEVFIGLWGPNRMSWGGRADSVTTDEHGTFVLRDCPRQNVELRVKGKGLRDTDVELDSPSAPLIVTVPRILRFKVHGRADVEADHFEVRDANGEPLLVGARLTMATMMTKRHQLATRDAPVYETSDVAEELVILDGETVVRRIPLDLRPGELNRIEW